MVIFVLIVYADGVSAVLAVNKSWRIWRFSYSCLRNALQIAFLKDSTEVQSMSSTSNISKKKSMMVNIKTRSYNLKAGNLICASFTFPGQQEDGNQENLSSG